MTDVGDNLMTVTTAVASGVVTVIGMLIKERVLKKRGIVDKGDDESGITAMPAAFQDHAYFTEMQTAINVRVPNMRCGCPGRTALFRFILTTHLSVWSCRMEEFCAKAEDPDASDTRIVKHAREALVAVALGAQKELDRRLDRVVITVFHEWWNGVANELGTSMTSIFQGRTFPDSRTRVFAWLAVQQAMIHIIMNDAHIVLTALNGTLDGMVFVDDDGGEHTLQHVQFPAQHPTTAFTPVGGMRASIAAQAESRKVATGRRAYPHLVDHPPGKP